MVENSTGISSLADVEAIERHGLPVDLPTSTYDVIAKTAARYPTAPALSFFLRTQDHHKPETWTYAELLARITQTANFFQSLGAKKDTVIAYILPNLPETHWTLWGAETAGIALAINPLLEADAIADLLNTAGATILVTLGPFPGTDLCSKIGKAIARCNTLEHLALVNLADRVSGLKGFVARALALRESLGLYGLKGLQGAIQQKVVVHDFGQCVNSQRADKLVSDRVIAPDDFSSYFCTGGTTGSPKIAMRRHINEVANAWSSSQFIGKGIGPGKTMFCGLPLFHVNGALVTGLMPFLQGAHVVLGTPQGYRGEGVVKRFWEIVERHKISFFSGVPTLYASLLDVPVAGHDISSLEYALCGAASMPVEVFRGFQNNTGLKILEGYGLTEGACVSSVNPPLGDRRIGSIGIRLPAQLMKTAILDAHGIFQRDCAVDEIGALLISGPNVFAGYKLPQQNEHLFIDDEDGRRWLNTGDLARQDADGYIWLTGRKKELIIRGGHNIDPASIEECLHKHSDVQIAAAVGRPDTYAGELPVAYVQLKENANVSEDALLAFVKSQNLERAGTPKFIRIIKSMPLTAVGKIFKPALKKMEIEDAVGTALKEGNVEFKSLSVDEDKLRGTLISVCVSKPSQLDSANKILGSFAVPFEISF